jgi:hypothetical protein
MPDLVSDFSRAPSPFSELLEASVRICVPVVAGVRLKSDTGRRRAPHGSALALALALVAQLASGGGVRLKSDAGDTGGICGSSA